MIKKVILITGVSSGFGKRSAELLAQKGHVVYGTIRSECEVDPPVKVLEMDLTNSASIQKAVDEIIQAEGHIDVLINNAGMHLGGPIEEAPDDLFKQQMDTNFNGMVHVIQNVVPHMRENGSGCIINISSIGGLMGLPFQAFYSASKFAIEGLSESLRMELKPFNIKVIVINPGDFKTSNTSNRINIVEAGGPYDSQFKKSLTQIEKDERGGWDPDILARKVSNIVEKKNPRYRYVIGTFDSRLAVAIKKILPVRMFSGILGSHYKIK